MLNRNAVWKLPRRLGMSWNEPARRSYGNAASPHRPRPGDGRIRDPLSPEEAQPGTGSRPRPRHPWASLPAWPGEY